MSTIKSFKFIAAVILLLIAAGWSAAQPDAARLSSNGPVLARPADESRTAAQLFEEADKYANKKFEALNKSKAPYDRQLEEKIKKEQRDLAAAYARELANRKIEGRDIYYLGLLYNLARDFDAALETMRRFLTENPKESGERAQNARAVIVIQAAKKGLTSEAEARLAEYAANEPQVSDDRYTLENWVAAAHFNAKDYDRALPHAREMWQAAKLAAQNKQPFTRDATLNEAAIFLSEVNLKLKKKEDALAVARELSGLALGLPSGNLYKLAIRRMLQIDPALNPFENIPAPEPATTAPEITASEWIEQTPIKLADLRGQVVLIDFWAPWCGPCRVTLPRFQKWHETYKDKGLVTLGLTMFYGRAEGKTLTRAQEMDYLRDFKKKFALTYGFAVADNERNDRAYTVSSIPTTFLVDRQGKVRFISVGSSEVESLTLAKMIKKLLDEPAPAPKP